MAPELFQNGNYDKSVDVFSFSLIVQEVCTYQYTFFFEIKFRYATRHVEFLTHS